MVDQLDLGSTTTPDHERRPAATQAYRPAATSRALYQEGRRELSHNILWCSCASCRG